mgnify:CR=1 FL=1
MKKVENDNIMKEYIKDAKEVSNDGEWAALEYDKELHDMMIQNNMIDEAKETGKKMVIDTISKCTGLSIEEIQNL